jgi:ferredoxin--NADP+ reductase
MSEFKVLLIDNLTSGTFHLRTERPTGLIRAGQCFNLGLPGMEINREYSMYSDANADYLDFLIRVVDGGLVSSRLQRVKIGEYVEIDGPYGNFCMQETKLRNEFYFIGTGTGIAPFHSFIKTYSDLNYKLIHGIRKGSEQYHKLDYSENKYIPCISQEKNSKYLRVTDYLIAENLDKNSDYYLCGNRKMIIDSIDILHHKGISGDNIFTEVFF